MKALLFDLDNTLVASNHLEQHRRTRDRAGLQVALPALRAPEGLRETLAQLARLQLGIVTTSPAWYARAVVNHLYPGVRWAALVTYGDVQSHKPHPQGLLLALSQLGVESPADATYVGDQDHDMEAALRAGMKPLRATWCGGVPRRDDEAVLRCPADLMAFVPTPVQPRRPGAATLQLLAYSCLQRVGRKTLLELLPDLAASRPPHHPRLDAALKAEGALEQAEQEAQDIVASCQSLGIRILSPLDSDYPAALKQVGKDQPALLYVRGQLSPAPALAVIGTREPTPHGLEITRRISTHFSARGYSVVSGLALGVDSMAHQAALDAGGHTVAVLAHGLHMVAPQQNRALAQKIVDQGGALVSEYAPGKEPRPPYFVERDRIQAGLARATVLIQTDIQGGSWHACRATLRYGRPLAYPVPTAQDLRAEEPKIEGIRLLDRGTDAERCAQLACESADLSRVVRLAGRTDYPVLEVQMERQLSATDSLTLHPAPLFGS